MLRWYDGVAWTEHVVDASRRTIDPAGAPVKTPAPAEGEVDRWLPPPSLPDAPRWGPFALGIPTGGPGAVPEGGYEPVLTGNRALDLTQSYVNEFESQLRRDASLVKSSFKLLRAAPALKRLGVMLALVAVAGISLLFGAIYLVGEATFFGEDPGGSFAVLFLLVPMLGVALPILYAVPTVVAFASGVAAGLRMLGGSRPSDLALFQDAWRARAALGALTLARLAWWRPGMTGRAGAALYEAFSVFAVPVAIEEQRSLPDAQRRSEELVAARWGPGRFRALGLPQTDLWSVVYSRGVSRFGYKAPYVAAGIYLLITLGPLIVAFAVGEPVGIVVAFAWMWGSILLSGLVWRAVMQPLLQGLLRAHLYHYARSGEAAEPYEREALHACLREEARAKLGLPQRRLARGWRAQPLGLSGVLRAFGADPAGYAQAEAGIEPADIREVISDARRLYKDGRLVTKALKGAGREGADASSLLVTTGLPRERCRITVINLIWAGKVDAHVGPDGSARFSLAT